MNAAGGSERTNLISDEVVSHSLTSSLAFVLSLVNINPETAVLAASTSHYYEANSQGGI